MTPSLEVRSSTEKPDGLPLEPKWMLWAADETTSLGPPKLKLRFKEWSPISTESLFG